VAVLFMAGSTCFAIGAFTPFQAAAGAVVAGIVFFVGSIFFTAAAYGQFVQSINGDGGTNRRLFAIVPRHAEWWAASVQLVGTLWFNVNTFDALRVGSGAHQQNLRVWTPDVLGSVCFLVASFIALRAASVRGSTDHRIGVINLAGSVCFMAAAIAAFTLPATDNYLDASLVNGGTFLGALCFFWGARLLLLELAPATTERRNHDVHALASS
jgi:hypothetical protein